ncbi:MAG: lipocalin-like domain-containing protein [Thermonemataceae bacterium]
MLYLLSSISFFGQQNDPEALVGKWELVEIDMHRLRLGEEALKAKKQNVVMEFKADQTYSIISPLRQAKVKTNQWKLTEEGKKIVLTSEDSFGKKYDQVFVIEQLNKELLVLSVGEEVDKEVYTYKALKN